VDDYSVNVITVCCSLLTLLRDLLDKQRPLWFVITSGMGNEFGSEATFSGALYLLMKREASLHSS